MLGAAARRWLALFVGAAGLLTAPGPAPAGTVPINAFGRPGDLHVDFPTYVARQESSSSGHNDNPPEGLVRPVGDVNGDGRSDVAMAISSQDPSWTTAVWVTFSPVLGSTTVNVDDPTWPGLKVVGAGRQIAGVAGVGDVNGDRIGDVAVAAAGGDAWVVFGGPVAGTVDVTALGDRGFSITGLSGCQSGGGGGNLWTGVFTRNSTIHGMGDQNGDGRPDLAVCASRGVHVVYTPASPAGAVVDATSLGAGGATLTVPSEAQGIPKIDALDDIDEDGRTDLAVGWTEADGAHVLGTPLPAPGTSVGLGEQDSSPTAWSVVAADVYLERFGAIGDDNADGRRDLTVSVVNQSGRHQMVVLGQAPGTRDALLPLKPAVGRTIDSRGSGVTDVGDQDGDGRPDLAYDEGFQLSASGEWASIDQSLPECVPLKSLGTHTSLVLCRLESKIVGTLPDSTGDGKPEIVAIHADPLPVQDGQTRATWRLDVFPSAPRPEPQELAPPYVLPDGGVGFTGAFLTAPGGATRSLAARAAVAVADDAGRVKTVAGELVDAGAAATTRATVKGDVKRLGLSAGRTYTYWMSLENGRGLTGVTRRGTFTYRLPAFQRSGPVLSALALSPSRFRATRGSRVRYAVSEASVTTFRVSRCATRVRARRGTRCTRFVRLRGRVTRKDRAGENGFRLKARVGTIRLRPGAYKLIGTPTNAAGVEGRPVSVVFRVVR